MTVADFIFKRLALLGIKYAFTITGGGAMHLNEALRKNTNIKSVFNHHEQACAIAAEGYARVTGLPAVVCVTTGPAGLNTINGVFGQWTDSVPVIYISGQVSSNLTSYNKKVRQVGDQECRIVDIVKPITKYAHVITSVKEVENVINTAFLEAMTDRCGPVWIDIPMDIQKAEYTLVANGCPFPKKTPNPNVSKVLNKLKEFKKLLVVVGNGVRYSGSWQLLEWTLKYDIPIASTFNGMDLIPSDTENYIGRIGTIGNRAANIALQNADAVLFLGTRNNIRQTGFNFESFAKNATKIAVDIDKNELKKNIIKYDYSIVSDLKYFIEKLCDVDLATNKALSNGRWLNWNLKNSRIFRNEGYDLVTKGINPYKFIDLLTDSLSANSTIVCGNGSACIIPYQIGTVKKGQRYIWNSGCASMGYDLPAAIGAYYADWNNHIICITGDGSIMMNLQELQTITSNNIPVKIFILNNGGYHSIKQTQKMYFDSNFYGCDSKSGVKLPNFKKIAKAFDIPYKSIKKSFGITSEIKKTLDSSTPVICEVFIDNEYQITPKIAPRKINEKLVSTHIGDMFPFIEEPKYE